MTESQQEQAIDSVIQLRFADEGGQIHDLNAAEFADVLQGLAEFTGQMARAGLFGDGPAPEVRVRPSEPGSVIITAVLHWANENPEAAVGVVMPPATGLALALRTALKNWRAQPSDIEYITDERVKIRWSDQSVDEVPTSVWRELDKHKRASKRTMRKLLAPLSDEADSLEVRNGHPDELTNEILAAEPVIAVDRTDYRIVATETDDVTEESKTFDLEAQLSSIDFRKGEKWRVRTALGSRRVTIEDDAFIARLDRGMALHKDDLFDVKVREIVTVRNGRTKKDWALTKITRKRRGGQDDVDHSPPTS